MAFGGLGLPWNCYTATLVVRAVFNNNKRESFVRVRKDLFEKKKKKQKQLMLALEGYWQVP